MKFNNLIKTVMFAACCKSVSKTNVAKHAGYALLTASLVAAIVNFAKPELIKNNFTTKYKLHILVVLFAISLIYLIYVNFGKIKTSFSLIKNKFVKKETAAKAAYAAEKALREAVFKLLKAVRIALKKELSIIKCMEEDAKSLLDAACAIKLTIKEAKLAADAAIKIAEDPTCPSEAARAAAEAAYIAAYVIHKSMEEVKEILNTAAEAAYAAAYKTGAAPDIAEAKKAVYKAYEAA